MGTCFVKSENDSWELLTSQGTSMTHKQCWSATWGGYRKPSSRATEITIKRERTDRKVRFQIRDSVLLCLILCATIAFAKSPKISKDLDDTHDGESVDVIIQYRVPPGKSHFDRIASKGGVLKADLRGVIRGAAFTVKKDALEDLANDPDVTYISPNRPLALPKGDLVPYARSSRCSGGHSKWQGIDRNVQVGQRYRLRDWGSVALQRIHGWAETTF